MYILYICCLCVYTHIGSPSACSMSGMSILAIYFLVLKTRAQGAQAPIRAVCEFTMFMLSGILQRRWRSDIHHPGYHGRCRRLLHELGERD